MRTGVLDDRKFLRPDEASRLVRHLEDDMAAALARGHRLRLRDAVLGILLLGTGVRVSEAVAMRAGDLVLTGGRRCVRVRSGKGGKPRVVVIGADLARVARRYLDALDHPGDEVPLFAAGAGTRPMSRTSAWRAWKSQLRAVGLDALGRGCHVARHTRATLLYATSRDLRLVGRELGHSDPRTTLIYADSLDEDRNAAADMADARMRGESAAADRPGMKQNAGISQPKTAKEPPK